MEEGRIPVDQFTTKQLRNVVLLGHSGAGKTSVAEAMLFATNATTRMGRVEDGNTISDFEPEEQKRSTSLQVKLLPCIWSQTKINILDTPGYADFVGESISALRVADAVVLVVSAPAGVEVGAEQMWQRARTLGLPVLVFLNKMDRENVDFPKVMDQLRDQLGRQCVAVNVPIGAEAQFADVASLVEEDPPAEVKGLAGQYRERLVEAVAETDDALTEKYLDSGELSSEEISAGLYQGVRTSQVVPVLAGAATQSKGITELLDAILAYLPAPDERPAAPATQNGQSLELPADPQGPLAALVFKTTADPFVGKLSHFRVYSGTLKANGEVWNAAKGETERIGQLLVSRGKSQENVPELVAGDIGAVAKLSSTTTGDTLSLRTSPIRMEGVELPEPTYNVAASPKSKADLDKMSFALSRLVEEDPNLRTSREPATGEFIVSSMGDTHVEVMAEKAKRKFGVELELSPPKIPYRETITRVARVEYRHKKQTGGHGQYGHVLLRLEPQPRGEGYQFASEVVGGNVPKEYIPAVEKGVVKAMDEGSLTGYPIVDVKVVLYDGSSHPVDSSGASFEIAGTMALKKGVQEGEPTLLEPVVHLHIEAPEQYAGDVIGDLNTRRARILSMAPGGGKATIEAEAPQAEVQQYSTTLRAITQGRGYFSASFAHFGEVPRHVVDRIAETARK